MERSSPEKGADESHEPPTHQAGGGVHVSDKGALGRALQHYCQRETSSDTSVLWGSPSTSRQAGSEDFSSQQLPLLGAYSALEGPLTHLEMETDGEP